MIGRRVASIDDLERAGDYCRVPIMVRGEPEQRMFFVMPNAPEGERFGWIAAVGFPPHTERECDDGSLEVRASILVHETPRHAGWHGYLDEGHVWREC